ncbi:DsbA family protein [Fibrisoma montanum]|uniref:DsbA family protein n=1 Tax=Fibrisoma montanum TaxID=2305895 RepID=A0A418MED1_9BACT|nr:DsbA family protein [Fibrisoma montanum]RIV25136.1 DsbA family protein [Fibrisoma montanum]
MTTQKPRIIYIYDALCGWCYGFSPVIRRFYDTYADTFDFDVLSGGMMTGPRVQPIGVSMSYIEQAYKVVEEHTGVQFGEAYLDKILKPGTYLSDSEKPGMAMTLFKALQTGRQLEFAGTLQKALYYDGIDLNVDANYGPLVEPFGVDPDEFTAHIADQAIKEQTWAEFNVVAQYGINGFPSVIVDAGNKLYLIARGYVPYERLDDAIKQITTT